MIVSQKKIEANRRNAKLSIGLGGRPQGVTASTQEYKRAITEYIAKRLADEIEPIVSGLVSEAKKGNVMAFVALADRAFGKAPQGLYQSDGKGDPIVFMPLELIQKHALQTQSGQAVKEVVGNEVVKEVALVENGSTKPDKT